MNDNEVKQKSDILCTCSGTTKTRIKQLIEKGFDMEQIGYETGANTGCGACDYLIWELIIQHRKQQKANDNKA